MDRHEHLEPEEEELPCSVESLLKCSWQLGSLLTVTAAPLTCGEPAMDFKIALVGSLASSNFRLS